MSNGVSSSTAALLSQTSLIASSPYTKTTNPYTGKTQYVYNAPDPISIDSTTLSAYASALLGTTSSATAAAATANANTAPTPPWSSKSTGPTADDFLAYVKQGGAFFDPSLAQLDAPAGTHQQDYQSLFALYQGLTSLQGLAKAASATGVPASQQTTLQTTFAKGLAQLQTFIDGDNFNAVDVSQGSIAAKQQSTAGAIQETDTYTTAPLVSGSTSTVVPSFQGSVAFSMQLKSLNGKTSTVAFDLSEMGSTPRSMANVVTYLNSKLSAAGVATRFSDVRNPGTAQTVQVKGAPVTVSTTADTFSLKILGTPLETLTMSAASSAPAVYVTSTQGAPGKTTSTVSAKGGLTTTTGASDVTQQLTKLNTGTSATQTAPGDATVFNNALASNPTAVRATATGPDGSVYVLADIAGKTSDGQAIKGTSDVALMKYDSAGTLQFTRTVGAANAANGYALSVSSDGTQVAIAGTTTGALDTTDTSQAAAATSGFVSVYSSAGEEQWTQARVSSATDTPTAVTFGSNGQVFIAGTTQGALLGGGGQVGGQDSYIEGFTGKQVTAANGTTSWTSSISFTKQFGTTGQDKPAGVAVSGSSLYVAGTENGHAVVRQYALQASGAPSLSATRDLGDLEGGEVAGLSIASDGSVVVAGATHNGALAGGTVGVAYTSGKQAFVAKLSAAITPSGSDKLNYVNAGADVTAKGMTLSGSKVYFTGQLTQSPAAGQTTGSGAYVAQIDPTSGAVSWSRTIQGADGIDAPTGIAVSATGSSALDALGLPSGTISYAKSTSVIANSSARAGDTFQVQAGSGAAKTITIEASDTFVSLAAKIASATGFQASASTTTLNGKSVIQIKPQNARTSIQLIAGPTGQDALKSLGLSTGEITLDASNTSASGATYNTGSNARSVLGLSLPTNLSVGTTATATTAQSALSLAIAKVENLYQDLTKPATTTGSNQQPLSASLSSYYSAQLANYQLALQRLGG